MKPIDPERLAALIDGRLAEADAAELRSLLADADEESLATFADAAAIAHELDATPAIDAGDVTTSSITSIESVRSKRKWPKWAVPTMAAAATILIAVVLTRPAGQGGESAVDPVGLVAAMDARVQPAQPVWDQQRSGEAAVVDEHRAARVGALLTDLALQVKRRDTTFRATAMSIAALLDAVPGSGPTTDRLKSIAGGSVEALDVATLREVSERSMQFVDTRRASAGAWLEAARLAMASGDRSFVTRVPAPATLAHLHDDPSLSAAAKADLSQLLDVGHPVELSSAQVSALERLLRELTRS